MIIDLRHLSGCQVIIGQYISFNSKVSIEEWSFKFQYFIAEFEGSLRDFSRNNLYQLFLKIFKNHCSKSWEPLYRAFIYIWDVRYRFWFYIIFIPSKNLFNIDYFLLWFFNVNHQNYNVMHFSEPCISSSSAHIFYIFLNQLL